MSKRCSQSILEEVLIHFLECKAGPWAFVLAAVL